MNLRKIVPPILVLLLLVAGWRSAGMQGLLVAVGGVLMWGLLHFTRLMNVMHKAAKRPIGHVASAVMLNAKLKPGVNLMHVVAMTRALGQLLSAPGEDPEVYRWTDAGGSHVTCEFRQGRLAQWRLERPGAAGEP
ncbi:hypothetical protein SAMN05428957_102490 [Oryzisolibacter propanilivorax]|uniref:Glycerate kinase n=1 Tax=Oryzisolibacter propanilivorax TaxID=1527607 RepID=A0A1G9QQ58_9BURK|nr:glycerate kinase [Oryzisolibacter propanilivorax]SDM13113.1 hypothetical protein SAMN05428957_102490 [Oryzisolibacter propanilivorax]